MPAVSETALQKKEAEVQALRDARDAAEANRVQVAADLEAETHAAELDREAESLRQELEFIKGATPGKTTTVDQDLKSQLAANAAKDESTKVDAPSDEKGK